MDDGGHLLVSGLTLHAADGRYRHAACWARGAPARAGRRTQPQLMPTLNL